MASTTNITTGIKAIKINRVDNQGNDNSLTLQELSILRIDLGDNTITQFNVLGIAEYTNYYLFYVEPVNFPEIQIGYFTGATSVDAGVLTSGNYTLSAGSSTGRLLGYSIASTTSGSNNNTTGQFTPTIPEPITVTINYEMTQPTGQASYNDDLWSVYITGSFGISYPSLYPLRSTGSTLEYPPGTPNPLTQSITFTPTNPSESIGIGFLNLGITNPLIFNISGTKIFYDQPDIIQSGTTYNSASADTTRSGLFTIPAATTSSITDWSVSSPYIGNEYYTPPLNDYYDLEYTASLPISFGGGGTGNISASFELWSTKSGLITASAFLVPIDVGNYTTHYISGSYTPVGGDQLFVKIGETTGNAPFTASNGSWEINQLSLPYNIFSPPGENNLVVLEPFVTNEFPNSDYNALINNTEDDRISDFYMDVDYSTNITTPVNYEAILSGSAERARVQSSNYTLTGWVNARYVGAKNTSPNVNISGSSTFTPSITSEGTYFAYFESVSGSNYEIINKTNITLKYLIDSSGNIQVADNSGSYYSNLTSLFNEDDNPVNVIFRTKTGAVDTLQGTKNVIRSGAKARAVLFTQTGSVNGSATSSITFGTEVVDDYRLNANISSVSTYSTGSFPNPIVAGTFYDLTFASGTTLGSDITAVNSTGIMTMGSSDSAVKVSPRTSLRFTWYDPSKNRDLDFTIRIQKQNLGSGTWNTIAILQDTAYSQAAYQTFNVVSPFQDAIEYDKYRVQAMFLPPTGGSLTFSTNTGTVTMFQNVSPTPSVSTAGIFTNRTANILTGSADINSSIYGLTQDTITNSGYEAPYLPFTVQRGDEIRFAASENAVYQILNVVEPADSLDGKLYLTLDRNVATGTTITTFLIRRYNTNGNNIIIDAKPTPATGTGFLFPQYPQNDLLLNFDTIIKNLTAKGVL